MKYVLLLRSFNLVTALLLAAKAASLQAANVNGEAGTARFECYATSDLNRIFEDGYGEPKIHTNALQLFGLRNETISGQLVLIAHEELKDLQLAISPLEQSSGSAIPQANVRWNFVGAIFIEKNSPNRQPADLLRPAPAWFPDYLSDERACSVQKGARKAVYLTIQIPPDAPPGEYRGSVTVRSSSTSVSLPLALQVYPLAVPQERHLFVTEWFSTSQFRKHHQLAPSDEERFLSLLKLYAENMAEHRQNVFRIGLGEIEARRTAEGKLDFDFSRFDRLAQVFWDTGRMDLLETGFVAGFGKGGWSGTEIVLNHFPVKEANGRRISMSGEEYLPQFLPALVAHLRSKGSLTKTVFHIADEPSNHNITAWRNASDFVHRLSPEFRRIDAIETPHCLGTLEVWVPKLDHLATWESAYEQAQREGNELWFYTVGIFQGGSLLNKTADVPLIETRLMHWLNYRYNLRGYLHWGFNAWTDDPINAPGEHRGDGWHVYPRKDGLLNSLRWEQMRNGLEDYECLWLLEHRISEIRNSLSARAATLIDPRQRGIEIALQIVPDYSHHTTDPEALYNGRRQAIEETLALDQSPCILLQTTPFEHSAVAKGCAIDLHGWAEPGLALTANGQKIPVADDGLFLAMIAPSADGKIVIEARGKAGKRSFTRQFKPIESPPAPGLGHP